MRYFIIFYRGLYSSKSHKPGLWLFDSMELKQENYPSKPKLIKEITETYGLKEVGVINILEVSEKDFKEWKTK